MSSADSMLDTGPHARRERPGQIKGPWIILITIGIVVGVSTFSLLWIYVLKPPAPDTTEPMALIWSERTTWPQTMFVNYKSLERGMMSAARTNETFKDLGFHVSAEESQAVVRLSALARQPEADFRSDATRQAIEQEIAALPELFYAYALLGIWHTLDGNAEAADRAMTEAFGHAPAALLRYHDTPQGQPATHHDVPTLAIAADQVVNDHLDRSLVLVYPFLQTDERGWVYLPAYKTILRRADPTLPVGVIEIQEKPRWFTFWGNVGRLPDETLP